MQLFGSHTQSLGLISDWLQYLGRSPTLPLPQLSANGVTIVPIHRTVRIK